MKYFVYSIISGFVVLLPLLGAACYANDMAESSYSSPAAPFGANHSDTLPTGQQAFDKFSASRPFEFLSFAKAKQSVAQTYNSFYQSLVEYSHKIEILPAATDGFYDSEAEAYHYLSMPLLAIPSSKVRFEFFSQAYDPLFYSLSHRSKDDTLHQYMPYADVQFSRAKTAFGIGATMALDERTQLRSIYTSGTIPGQGDAKVGLQLHVSF